MTHTQELVLRAVGHFTGKDLEFDCSTSRAGVTLIGQTSVLLEGLRITVSGDNPNQGAAIYLKDCSDITIQSCEILVKGSGGGIAVDGGQDISIRDCKITMPEDSHARHNQAIQLKSRLPGNQKDHWKSTFSILTNPNPLRNVLVGGCTIHQGYYGIGVSSVTDFSIIGNHLSGNMRGMSIQDGSSEFNVRWNTVRDNVSAGIHCAYGAHKGLVSTNIIESSTARGEGFLQAYVGCRSITFSHNLLESSGDGPKYYLYAGIDSSDILFTDNKIHGKARKSHAGVEAFWDSSLGDKEHRSHGASTADDGMSHGTTSAVLLDNPGATSLVVSHRGVWNTILSSDIKPTKVIT